MKGEALKAVGVLEQITSLFSAQRIPILQFGVTGIGENLMLTIFADVGDEKTAAKVVEDIRKTPYALQVWYSKPIVKGFCYDNFCFPPTIEGERVIILSKPYYEGFITEG
jgi:predicted amino acid-binding ACT domain protein